MKLKLDAAFAESFQASIDERSSKSHKMTHYYLDPEEDKCNYLPAQGSIMCIAGRKKSERFSRLEKASQESIFDANRVIEEYIKINENARILSDLDATINEVSKIPTLIDVRHGNKTLAHGYPVLFDDDRDLTIVTFPYTGGALSGEGLELVSLSNDLDADDVSGLVFVKPPRLSDLERAALDQLPSSQNEINVGSPVAATPLAAGVVLATGLLTAIAWCATKYNANIMDYAIDPIDPSLLAQMTPDATAKQLLRARSSLMKAKEIGYAEKMGWR